MSSFRIFYASSGGTANAPGLSEQLAWMRSQEKKFSREIGLLLGGGGAATVLDRSTPVSACPPQGMAYVDADLKYTFVNDNYAAFFAASCADMSGQRVDAVSGERNRSTMLPYLQQALAGQPCCFEVPFSFPHAGERQDHRLQPGLLRAVRPERAGHLRRGLFPAARVGCCVRGLSHRPRRAEQGRGSGRKKPARREPAFRVSGDTRL